MALKRICVFCGSKSGSDPEFESAAESVGALMAKRKIGLVFGGGTVGLMGVVSRAVAANGGEAIGVIPHALVEKERANFGVADLRVVNSMHERKQLMHDLSDGFVALPGGIGTMEELFEAWTWLQLGFHKKPIAILNTQGYYDSLIAFLDQMAGQGFLRSHHRDFLIVANDAAELLDRLAAWAPPLVPQYIGRGET
jgi:hypothetical protein